MAKFSGKGLEALSVIAFQVKVPQFKEKLTFLKQKKGMLERKNTMVYSHGSKL